MWISMFIAVVLNDVKIFISETTDLERGLFGIVLANIATTFDSLSVYARAITWLLGAILLVLSIRHKILEYKTLKRKKGE